MKKIIATLSIVLMAVVAANAQSAFAAETALTNGDLAKAKEEIDGTIAKEIQKIKEKNDKYRAKGKEDKVVPEEADSKTLLVKGKVYKAIATSTDPEVQGLAENPIEEATSAFKKVLEREGAESLLGVQVDTEMNNFYGGLLNTGVEFYNNDDTENAVKYFYSAGMLMEDDTTGLNNAFLVAAQNEMPEKTEMIGKAILERGTGNADFYLIYANEFRKKEDYEGLLAVAEAGEKAFPENADMGKLKVEAYSKLDRIDEAIALLEKEATSSTDPVLFGNLAIMYDNKGNIEKSAENYAKAIELDPENYGMRYNLGALYYNQAVEIAKERNNLPSNNRGEFEDQEKAKELGDKLKEFYKQAEPHFAKAYELKPEGEDAITLLSMLSQMYRALEMDERKKEVDAKLKELDKEQE